MGNKLDKKSLFYLMRLKRITQLDKNVILSITLDKREKKLQNWSKNLLFSNTLKTYENFTNILIFFSNTFLTYISNTFLTYQLQEHIV